MKGDKNRRRIRGTKDGKSYVLEVLPTGGIEFRWLRSRRKICLPPSEVLGFVLKFSEQSELF